MNPIQESIVSALHLTEVAIALNVLSAGGSFVLKMFTLFEPQSRAMMLLLAAVFDQVCRRMFKILVAMLQFPTCWLPFSPGGELTQP